HDALDQYKCLDMVCTLVMDWFRYFFFQAEDGIRDKLVTGVQTCALPIWRPILGETPGEMNHRHAVDDFFGELHRDKLEIRNTKLETNLKAKRGKTQARFANLSVFELELLCDL